MVEVNSWNVNDTLGWKTVIFCPETNSLRGMGHGFQDEYFQNPENTEAATGDVL